MQKRVAMMRRSIIFLVCISMVGVTILPASLIPCCCKSKGEKIRAEGAQSVCPLHKAARFGPPSPASSHSCCAFKVPPTEVATATCCTGDTLLQDCGNCRCLEQMQIVALSGYSCCQVSVRVLAVPIPHPAESSILSVDRDVYPSVEVYSPQNVVLLRTCSLLI
jgi:hypothetical protein